MKYSGIGFLLLTIFSNITFAQNNRLNHNNTIGWVNYFGTVKATEKMSLQTEYQWRRAAIIKDWQQSLLRLGVTYHWRPSVLLRVGYAWVETFPYGTYPINRLGRDFTEHRIYEMVQLSHQEGRLECSHRFMLEQRFVGRYSTPTQPSEDEYPLLHRARYLFRFQLPLLGRQIKNKTPYVAAYDEVFIGFGNNVNANIFDQNRIGLLLGYRLNKNLRVEAGYINQIIQFGRLINGKNVFQYNNGIILNTNVNFNISKQQKEQ